MGPLAATLEAFRGKQKLNITTQYNYSFEKSFQMAEILSSS